MADAQSALHALNLAASLPNPDTITRAAYQKLVHQSRAVPRISSARLQQSLSELPVDVARLHHGQLPEKTFLYLGYGSNMCALSFLKRRKIKPLGQLNIVAPEFQLSFDLTGTPYTEPCFANLKPFEPDADGDTLEEQDSVHLEEYHKDRWRKGLVAIVYEVTASDFAHILATEGGGTSYHWILTDCYELSSDPHEPVPLHPKNLTCKAWTLFAKSRTFRPDPSYAQPSARYLKLLTDGGYEHDLPTEYREFLDQIRTYTITTKAQKIGMGMTTSTWLPLTTFFFRGGGKIFLRPDGSYPKWYGKMAQAVYRGTWAGYDKWFKPRFGDGERTIEDGGIGSPDPHRMEQKASQREEEWSEKNPLLGSNTIRS